tara:strand:+ start:236 stop:715 length:480 start_codon:yes stop_codon:yes gene_type:complete
MNIAQSSPLNEYWNSDQDENDEKKRLLKLNPKEEPASNLFRNEPYKWENLYQSILRNIISGDESSIKGLMILLSTISKEENDKVLNSLEALLDKHIIDKLREENYQDIKSSKNFFTALKILITIFINPYDLELKQEQKHIYEKIGMLLYQFRKFILSNK